MRVQVPPRAPRQKNSAPFRFRGLRKSRENCTSAESFFLYQIEPASLGFDLNTGSDLVCPGAPERGLPKGSPLQVSRLRRDIICFAQIEREGITNPLSRFPHANLEGGSDLDCHITITKKERIQTGFSPFLPVCGGRIFCGAHIRAILLSVRDSVPPTSAPFGRRTIIWPRPKL